MTPLTITKIRACYTPQRTPGQRLWSSASSTLILCQRLSALQQCVPYDQTPEVGWCNQLWIMWYRAMGRESPVLPSSYTFPSLPLLWCWYASTPEVSRFKILAGGKWSQMTKHKHTYVLFSNTISWQPLPARSQMTCATSGRWESTGESQLVALEAAARTSTSSALLQNCTFSTPSHVCLFLLFPVQGTGRGVGNMAGNHGYGLNEFHSFHQQNASQSPQSSCLRPPYTDQVPLCIWYGYFFLSLLWLVCPI